jgi:hypothetical protein
VTIWLIPFRVASIVVIPRNFDYARRSGNGS